MEAYDELDAVTHIKQTCDIVLKITEVKDKGEGMLSMNIGSSRLDPKELTMMCSRFAIIIKAGIPIARAVHLIANMSSNKPLKNMLTKVAEDVEGGRTVADSFEDRGAKLLPPTFIETIRAGEQSGNLDNSFDSMAKHYDKQTKMRGKVKSALAYPAFVMVIAVVVVIVLMVKVVPTFTAIFDSYGANLPTATKILIAISNFFSNNIIKILIIVVVLAIAYKVYGSTESGKVNYAKLGRKLPVLGNVNILTSASEFSNTMAMMLQAGLPMTRAIAITSRVMSNYYVSQEVEKLIPKIEEGRTLTASMRETDAMPDILVDMVAVGEETGEMEETLNTVAGYYDSELETAVEAAVAKLQPATLIFLAVVAGFIVLAVYMAMFDMYAAM